MWNQLFASILLEKAGFHPENGYEDTLNRFFIENPEDESLLELEFLSSDLIQSFHMFMKDCYRNPKYDMQKVALILCEKLEKIYDRMPLKDFVPCAYRLWEILPCRSDRPLSDLNYIRKPPSKKNAAHADATYREMFRYYSEGIDKEFDNRTELSFQQYTSVSMGAAVPDFDRAEILLGFQLNQSIRIFYSRAFAKRIVGTIFIQDKNFTLPIGNERFDTWFSFNKIKGNTKIQLFPCPSAKASPRFIRDQFYTWTGWGNDFGERALIGELETGNGQIEIVINNQTDMVEWIDCGYGHFDKFEKNPHGILAENLEQFLQKLC